MATELQIKRALREELRGAIRKVHYAPDGCNMAIGCTTFMRKVYVHFNNTVTETYRLYEFDPEAESWRAVRDVNYWDLGVVSYCPQAPLKVALFYSDGKYFDGEAWRDTPEGVPVAPREVDRENGVAYGTVGTTIKYCDDLDRMLDSGAWKDDVDAKDLFPNLHYVGCIMRVGSTVFATAGERVQTPAEVAKRNAPGDWTVKKYRDLWRPLSPLTEDVAGGAPLGSSFPNSRTFRLGGTDEEVGLINAFDGHIYFLTADGKLKRVLETRRMHPAKVYDVRYYRAPTYYGGGIWAGWGCLVGDYAVFHAPGGGTGRGSTIDLWMFDGMQFYRVASLPMHARGMTYCDGRLYLACHMHCEVDASPELQHLTRAFLVELELDVLERRELPPRTLRVWDGYSIGTDGLYSDDEYVDADGYYHPATEILTLGYERKAIYLVSDQDGTLDVEIDPDLRGDWKAFDSVSVTANKLCAYMTTHPFARMRFKFTPSATAKVYAWVNLEGGCA